MKKEENVSRHDEMTADNHCAANRDSGGDFQKQLADQAAQLRAKGELIDNLIYQIRTLSNAVIGFSDLLLTEELTRDQAEYAREISDSGQALSVLVNDVLDWAQLLSGRLQVTKAKCSLSEIIRKMRDRLVVSAEEKSLDIAIAADPELPAHICSDEDRLLKCLINLTANAIQYTTEDSAQIHVRLDQSGDQPAVCFDIVVSGATITPEEIEGILAPAAYKIAVNEEVLWQLGNSLVVTAGMPLTKQLCELLNGTIAIQSRPRTGAVFSLRIPADVDLNTEPRLGTTDRQAVMGPQTASSETVLLVEDQQSNRTVISLMLEALGVQVDTAEDGEAALQKVEQNSYDLILMDLKMPRMDGYEATRRLRQKAIQVPIIALSAKVLREADHHQIAAMFDGFLTKPVDSRKLSETIGRFIRKSAGPNDTSEGVFGEDVVAEHEMVTFEYGN